MVSLELLADFGRQVAGDFEPGFHLAHSRLGPNFLHDEVLHIWRPGGIIPSGGLKIANPERGSKSYLFLIWRISGNGRSYSHSSSAKAAVAERALNSSNNSHLPRSDCPASAAAFEIGWPSAISRRTSDANASR